jgi:AraC family transcriptional regulator
MRTSSLSRKKFDDEPVSSELLVSSAERRWTGFTADVWAHSEGYIFHKRTAWDTELAIDVTGRSGAIVERYAENIRNSTVADRGTIWLAPCRLRETTIRISAPLPGLLHLKLPPETFVAAGIAEDIYRSLVPLMYYDGGFDDPLIVSIGEAILSELRNETSAGRLLVESLASSLAVRLIQQHLVQLPATVPEVIAPLHVNRRRMSHVLEYIDANVEIDLSLDELAAIACMSRFHFSRVFKLATGMPPYKYLSTKRFERARELLDGNDRSLWEIASVLGFSSESNFSRAFRQFTGFTPRQFRERRK